MQISVAFALIALAGAAPPAGQVGPSPPEAPPPPASTDLSIGLDIDSGRMTVPVSIGTSGPYKFVIDTGAERSVISRELATALALTAGKPVRLIGLAGTATVETVHVPELSISTLGAKNVEAPALATGNIGARGMLGIDALQGHRITIDFDRRAMKVTPSGRRIRGTSSPGDILVSAKNLYGQLIVTDARYHGERISVIIDTGSPISIGNRAMLNLARRSTKSLGPISVTSVTGQVLDASYVMINDLHIAGLEFDRVPMAVADVPPFKRFGLEDSPALILGMDTMRLFRRVNIDFANRQILFSLPAPRMATRGCSAGTSCSSYN
ncbi:aspartyl protease family protein [Sphingomonas alpina]|uniref:Aspartyl protease family protein n=1 Tax=Sphingomonas alpina TaxID=653931 RepID=A0A7H0LHQ2_9SPHN|nr:aspartyl protease family protein [Sphingomonas alpina]QNQ09205.1 aspartyl protease family protein [Sphingomonas alpina]